MSGAALGLLAGLAFSLASPPQHSATTILLLEHPIQSDKPRAMQTDAQLAKSRTVAQAAVQRLGLRMSPTELAAQYQSAALSQDLLQIRVSGPNDREAVRRAEAVAESFLAFRRDELRRQSDLSLESLEERERELNAELLAVENGIKTHTGTLTEAEQRELADLLVRQAGIGDKLTRVRQRIDVATFDTLSVNEKTRVIDPAGADARSPAKMGVLNSVAGLILGLLLTTGWITMQEVITDRPRRREGVARALGTSVAVSMAPLRGPMWLQRRRFQSLLSRPTADVANVVEHVRRVLNQSRGERKSLVLVSVESDAAAALAAAATTVRLMHEGWTVLLVDLTPRNILARLTKARPQESDRLPLVGDSSALWVSFPPHQRPQLDQAHPLFMQGSGADAQVDVVLALGTIDPAVGAANLVEVANTAIAIATAGRSSETRLRSVAQMSEAAELRVDSAILVGADPRDESVGLRGGRRTTIGGMASPPSRLGGSR